MKNVENQKFNELIIAVKEKIVKVFEVFWNQIMHIWIHLILLIILAYEVWILIASYDAYEQLIDECRLQIVEQPEEEIAQEPIELNKLNNDGGITSSMIIHTFVVVFGYLSFHIL